MFFEPGSSPRLGQQCNGAFGMQAQFRGHRQQLGGDALALVGKRIDPEVAVLHVPQPGLFEQVVRGHQLPLRLVDLACLVSMKCQAKGRSEAVFGALARLPTGRRAKENAEPVLIEDALSVVVPNRIQHTL